MISTTLMKLRAAEACVERYTHLREALGKGFKLTDTLPLTRILELNGLEDTLWALGNAVEGGEKIYRLFAADCAEHVLHLYIDKYPNDNRPAEAIKATRQFARGEITAAARAVAWEAAEGAASAAATAAAWAAATAAEGAASDAVSAAAWDARDAATAAARDAATAARAVASDAVSAAAWDAEQKWQTERLIQYLKEEV